MASSFMPITQTVSSKLYARIYSSRSDYYAKSFQILSTTRKICVNQSFRLDRSHSNQKTLKHQTRARKLGAEREEREEDDDDREEDEDDRDETEEKEDQDDKEDYGVEEVVLKLYSDIKDRNIDGISEVIGDECQCFCNFLSTYRLLQGKKQVMAFFYWLMMKLGKDIKIVVKPTSKDGMTIGVQWQLEWEKPQIQLGKGFSFHICHIYQGKLLIKNVEMFMEPIFHIEPLRLRTMAFGVSLAEKIVTYLRPLENIRKHAMTLLLLSLLLFAAAAFYFTRPRF
ncbi:unnamed protein product [Thlaspi arvense]|uniref:Uncharacterized protein n=1 Tax=Thlaspi arvense TaxID=13288 RepID=A0AAU9T8B1_THLAR|nr:unnamed protein product [Thlaspi arvense]